MDQFNRDTYKKDTIFQEFYHSCMGKIIILAGIAFILFLIGIITLPSESQIQAEVYDNIHQCLQDNENEKNDELDEDFANVVRTFTVADTTLTNRDALKWYKKYNTVAVYDHTSFATAYIHNTIYPQGVRVGIAVFGMVISTINYEDLILDVGPARGRFQEKLYPSSTSSDTTTFGENPHLNPYHYNGNPED